MLNVSRPSLGIEEELALRDCIKEGWVSYRGPKVSEFERKFAAYIGTDYAVACSSGTSALHLALLALGIGPGDEVIVPALTFIATANAVSYTGAKPVFVDSHINYWCMDPGDLESKITSKTCAIIPVHLYGHPCDMDQILSIARSYNLKIVEDCAESLGAEISLGKCGNLGDVGCFSFFANKIITCGEGGMCTTNDKTLADNMRIYGDHGTPGRPYGHDRIGYNYRLTSLQAAVGLAQLNKISDFLARRSLIRSWYDTYLPKGLVSMPEEPWAKSVNWIYTCLLNWGTDVEKVRSLLLKEGIETRPVFETLTNMPPYKSDEKFPMAFNYKVRGLSLPTYLDLTELDIIYICGSLKEALR